MRPFAMARVVVLIVTLCGVLFVATSTVHAGERSASRSASPSSRPPFVPGELLVEYRAGVTSTARGLDVRSRDGRIVRTLHAGAVFGGGTIVLVHSARLSTGELRRRFDHDPTVVRTSPNYVRSACTTVPDDPGLAGQWGFFQVGAPEAWQTTQGSSGAVVAVIDTGVSLAHPDLAADLWRNAGEVPGNHVDDDGNGYVDDTYGFDAVENDGVPLDLHGHGTHVAGIVAGIADNGVGIAGVAPKTPVMAVQALSADGSGTDAGVIEAIGYVVHEKLAGGVNVVAINASWGGPGNDQLVRDAIVRAGDAGIVFCAAAGNSSVDLAKHPVYPAAWDCPTMITVAATDRFDRLAWFSDYGTRTVDLGAPGVGILSTMTVDGYATWDGTSMATPFVSAAVALCAAAYPAETAAQRVDRILSSARPVAGLAGKCVTGGRLDLAAAVGQGPVAGDDTAPTTTALGADDARHDVPVSLAFAAVDDPGGSGVAGTEWRVDGQAWHDGVVAVVRPPEHARVARTVAFRSTDRAGNAEAAKTVVVRFDTTAPSDDRLPGVTLPPSPVRGDVGARADPDDVYAVHLEAGQAVRLTMSASPACRIYVGLFRPGAKRFSFTGWDASPLRQATSDGLDLRYGSEIDRTVGDGVLAYRATKAGTYRVVVLAEQGNGAYRLDYDLAPPGVDVVPPGVSVLGTEFGRWNNYPVWLNLRARDGDGGSGLAAVETSPDGGLTWVEGTEATVDAPADHSNDGSHLVLVRARDNAGNLSAASVNVVGVDTLGPSTEAWGPRTAVRRGDRVYVRFRISDALSRWATGAQLVVRTAGTGAIVKTIRLSSGILGRFWTNVLLAYPIRVSVPPGAYEVTMSGTTRDEAGNPFVDAVCRRTLRVR
jgi:subtilisin family serine protease